MMLKIAHMRENRKNNKGFSLVELIIVMAIMVALVAVLAPQYIRYLQRSRDAVVANAGEDVMTAVKTDIIDPEGTLKMSTTDGAKAFVYVNASGGTGGIIVTTKGFTNDDANGIITNLAGISAKTVKSTKQVQITITYKGADGTYDFNSVTVNEIADVQSAA